MSKLLSSVLDKISENNNDYRKELRNLSTKLEEKEATFVGDIVTASNYTLDFSNTISISKEKITNTIIKIVESYTIKDLRSVETVNEQFVEKINDKIENTEINSTEEKESFIESLHTLLNEKYLEIVKIKRVPFFDDNGENELVMDAIRDFTFEIGKVTSMNDTMTSIVNSYKMDLYQLINESLKKISDLYLNNFVSEISSSLNSAVDYVPDIELEQAEEPVKQVEESYQPFIPEIKPLEALNNDVTLNEVKEEEKSSDTPLVLIDEDRLPKLAEFVPPILPSRKKLEAKKLNEQNKEETKKTYDVEEILKIAKSPVVQEPEPVKETSEYTKVTPIALDTKENIESHENEKEVVEEMIRRLTKRLEDINVRESNCEEQEEQVKEDEDFVNDLIESADKKKVQLDELEDELNQKEKELEDKEEELNKKINSIMPFANAVMENEK